VFTSINHVRFTHSWVDKKKKTKQNGCPEPIQHYQTTVTNKQTKWLPRANTTLSNDSNKQTNKQNDCPEPIQHYQTRSKQQ
jgi:predicted transcriptional regulator